MQSLPARISESREGVGPDLLANPGLENNRGNSREIRGKSVGNPVDGPVLPTRRTYDSDVEASLACSYVTLHHTHTLPAPPRPFAVPQMQNKDEILPSPLRRAFFFSFFFFRFSFAARPQLQSVSRNPHQRQLLISYRELFGAAANTF
jgi:hypothetical protein